MQRYHRSRHRFMWIVLGPLAFVLLVVAIKNRPTWPVMDTLPSTPPSSITSAP